jgi:hypothetical protein
MKTYHVEVRLSILEVYEIEAGNEEEARLLWNEGKLIYTHDEAFDRAVLAVREIACHQGAKP